MSASAGTQQNKMVNALGHHRRMDQNQHNLQAPLLDRLIDEEPGLSHEPVQYRLLSIGQIKTSVIRDLENLLNARRHILVPPDAFVELNNSLFVYGLRDYTAQNPRSPAAKQQLRMDVEQTIACFEPRLKNVAVQLETPGPNERVLRFRISALLVIEPLAEPVTFDTFFDVNRGEYVIAK
jgi:type VI secretion system protein ImpF